MKRILLALGATTLATTIQAGDIRIDRVCGNDDVILSAQVEINDDGYFVVATSEQINHGDPRILIGSEDAFTVCTRNAAIPEMSATEMVLSADQAHVSWVFVPDKPHTVDTTG